MRQRSDTWIRLAARGTARMESVAVIGGVEYAAISAPIINRELFSADTLSVGNCISSTLKFSVLTSDTISKSASIIIKGRLVEGETYSEWLEFGTFYIDRRTTNTGLVTFECYDAMLKANQQYVDESNSDDRIGWPKSMQACVTEIAYRLGVEIDSRTAIKTTDPYVVPYPTKYTMTQVLGYIGAVHGGNWIITPENKLRLVPLVSPPAETFDIIDYSYNRIYTDDGYKLVWKHTTTDEVVEQRAGGGIINVPVVVGKITTGRAFTISRVTITRDSELGYTAGDSTGFELQINDNPYACQAICDDLLAELAGIEYAPFTITSAYYDPASELGDWILVGEQVRSVLCAETVTLGMSLRVNASAPGKDELDSEYPHLTEIKKLQQEDERLQGYLDEAKDEINSKIEQTHEDILLEVSGTYATKESVSSSIKITTDAIEQEVTRAKEAEGSLSSRITSTAESITAEVTRAQKAENELKSTIEQTGEKIELKVQEIRDNTACPNLLLNANFHRQTPRTSNYLGSSVAFNDWGTWANDSAASDVRLSTDVTLYDDPAVYLGYTGSGTSNWAMLHHTMDAGYLPAGNYTLSVYLRRYSAVAGNGFNLAARYVDANGVTVSNITSAYVSNDSLSSDSWTRFSLNFEITDESNAVRVLFQMPTTGGVYLVHPKLEAGNEVTAWIPHVNDDAYSVSAGAVRITYNRVDVESGGSVNISAGGALNVEGAEIHLRASEEFDISFVKNDGDEVVMNMEENGSMTFGIGINAPNVRNAEFYSINLSSDVIGGLAGLAEYLKTTDARYVIYTCTADDNGARVTFDRFNGHLDIRGQGYKIPAIFGDFGMTGEVRIYNAILHQTDSSYFALQARGGKWLLDACWFTESSSLGLLAQYCGEILWWNTRYSTPITLTTFMRADYCAQVRYAGNIPGGEITQNNGGFFEESPYGSTVYGGDGSGSSETPTTASVSLVAALGVIGTKYSWHSDIAYQGYSNGKGQCYGCLKFTLPSDAKSIVSASLTLHRKSNTGKGAEVDIFLYGSATAWGSKPTLSTKYNTSLDAVLAGRSTVLDVLAAAQALLAGTITQFVLYTGETTTLSGQVYSSNYCAWDEAVLSITYTT